MAVRTGLLSIYIKRNWQTAPTRTTSPSVLGSAFRWKKQKHLMLFSSLTGDRQVLRAATVQSRKEKDKKTHNARARSSRVQSSLVFLTRRCSRAAAAAGARTAATAGPPQRHSKRIFVRFTFFRTFTRCKTAFFWHFVRFCGVFWAVQNHGKKGAAKGAARRWPKNAAISHEVPHLRRFCGT